MMSDKNIELEPLRIAEVSVIANYGWKHDFQSIQKAIAFVNGISLTVQDPTAPLNLIKVRIEYTSGEEARVSYKSKVRVARRLERCLAEVEE